MGHREENKQKRMLTSARLLPFYKFLLKHKVCHSRIQTDEQLETNRSRQTFIPHSFNCRYSGEISFGQKLGWDHFGEQMKQSPVGESGGRLVKAEEVRKRENKAEIKLVNKYM